MSPASASNPTCRSETIWRRRLARVVLPAVLMAAAGAGASAPRAGTTAVIETGGSGLRAFACDNRAEVVIDARPGSRTVFVEIGVRVGSRDEPEGLAGMSHLLEHLLFKEGHGPNVRPNPAYAALRAAGGLVNASTDFEMTEYHADLPAGSFAQGWDALVSMVTTTAFDEQDVAREREVVLQEAALGKIDPIAIVAYSVLGRIFPGDPIAQPVIGFRSTLKRIAYRDLEEHHRRFYTPANMFALVVGDVDPDDAEARVRLTLGAAAGGGAPHPPYPAPIARTESLYRFRTLVKQSYLLAGSLTHGESSDDAMALELLSSVLGEGRASRLHRRLVRDEALADDVLAIAFSVSTAGALAAGLATDPRLARRADAALVEELRRLATEPVGQDEMEIARSRMRGQLAQQFETNEGIAEFRARRLLLRQPLGRDAYLARAEALSPGDLLRVARSYWGDDPAARDAGATGLIEIQVLPARGFGKVIAALKFLFFRHL